MKLTTSTKAAAVSYTKVNFESGRDRLMNCIFEILIDRYLPQGDLQLNSLKVQKLEIKLTQLVNAALREILWEIL